MNRLEIEARWDTLTPCERDAWVAEVVFGHTILPNRRAFSSGPGGANWPIPEYTTDISSAWTVFETFEYAECARLPFRPNCYGVRINGTDGSIRAMTQAPTAPEAICLAALIAKLTEVS